MASPVLELFMWIGIANPPLTIRKNTQRLKEAGCDRSGQPTRALTKIQSSVCARVKIYTRTVAASWQVDGGYLFRGGAGLELRAELLQFGLELGQVRLDFSFERHRRC